MLIVLTVLCSLAGAEPLKFDGWKDTRHQSFLKWLYSASDASRPCSLASAKPPPGVEVLMEKCTVTRDAGQPTQRERKLRLRVEHAFWSGHEVEEVAYEQQYSIQEELVYHASMEFTVLGPSNDVSKNLRALWAKRGLQPTRDKERSRDLIHREAGIEWVKGAGNKTVFATEFYE